MKEIKFSCPNCGTEFTINASTPSAETTASSTKSFSKAELRILALEKAGVDTHNYFAVTGMENVIARFEPNGALAIVRDDDAIFDNDTYREIIASGHIPSPQLFRRWVMSQMFHIFANEIRNPRRTFDEQLKYKGYEYSWKMVVEEMRVQAKLFKVDADSFVERNHWFYKDVCFSMAVHYIDTVERLLATRKVRKCKGKPYKTLSGVNMFVEDIEKHFLPTLRKSAQAIHDAENPSDVYKALVKFNSKRLKLWWSTPLCDRFVDAYKGSGAYFTMKNLVLFHGCTFCTLTKEQSIEHLNNFLVLNISGNAMINALRSLISENGIDINAKIAEWQK